MKVRLKELIDISINLTEVLKYDLTDSTRKELKEKLDLADMEIIEISDKNPVIY